MGVTSDNTSLSAVSGYGNRWANPKVAGTFNYGKAGSVLSHITINTTAAGTIIIRDGSRTIATLPSNAVVGTYTYKTPVTNRITVELGAASDVTVVWSV